MKNITADDFIALKQESGVAIANLLNLDNSDISNFNVAKFNKVVFKQRLCPIFTKALKEEFNEIKKINSNGQLKSGLENNIISKNHDCFVSGKIKAFWENSKKYNLKRLEKIQFVSIFIQDKQSLIGQST